MGAAEIRMESDRVALVRTRRRRRIFGVLAALACALPFVQPALSVITFFIALYGTVAFFAKPAEPNFALAVARKAPGHVAVDEHGVEATSAGATVHYTREDVLGGWLANVWGPFVVLRLRGGDLVAAEVRSPEQGAKLLASLGLSAEQKVLDVALARRPRQLLWVAALVGCFGLAAVALTLVSRGLAPLDVGTLVFGGALGLATLAATFRAALGLTPQTVRIGTDGLLLRGGGARRFLRYADITRIDRATNGLRVSRGARRAVMLPCWGVAQTTLLGRIEQAMAIDREAPPSQKQQLLDRGGASLETWRERLAQLAKGGIAAGYRGVALEHDELAQILEDASAPPERRVAAAFALSSNPDMRLRVRAAAEACADERVRIAIERAEQGDLDDLAALEAEPESVPARAKR
jgi:hypothetical protein